MEIGLKIELNKMWARLVILEDALENTSDTDKSFANISKNASRYRNLCKNKSNEAIEILEGLIQIQSDSKSLNASSKEYYDKVSDIHENISIHSINLQNRHNAIEEMFNKTEANLNKANKKVAIAATVQEQLIELKLVIENGLKFKGIAEEISNESNMLKNEIDDFHKGIFGYENSSETDESIFVPGLKNRLSNVYEQLNIDAEILQKRMDDMKGETLDYYEEKLSVVVGKLYELMPEALTKGLSSSFNKKKVDEIQNLNELTKRFYNSIKALVGVSIIPFVISFYQLAVANKSLESLIIDSPKLILAILPIYIPILWLAQSNNKSAKLSKRLIEEYTHKEVISSTYEGLSTQINNLDDSIASEELRVKLLYNILDASAENPGKLISDYNKSDHPLMDALDKSVQLSNALSKLSYVPGVSRLLKKMTKHSDETLAKQTKQVNDILEKELDEEEG